MKMFRTNRLQPLLPLCAGLSLAACFATTRAADAPRSLDWSRAATGQPGAAAPAMAPAAPAPAPARASRGRGAGAARTRRGCGAGVARACRGRGAGVVDSQSTNRG